MKEKPRSPQERLINTRMMSLIGIVSLISGLITLTSFIFVYKSTGDLTMARSMAFIVLGLDSLICVFSIRTLMTPFWKSNPFENKWLVVAVIAGFALQILPFTTPTIRQFFGLANLPPYYWLVGLGLSVFMFMLVEALKWVYSFSDRHRTCMAGQS